MKFGANQGENSSNSNFCAKCGLFGAKKRKSTPGRRRTKHNANHTGDKPRPAKHPPTHQGNTHAKQRAHQTHHGSQTARGEHRNTIGRGACCGKKSVGDGRLKGCDRPKSLRNLFLGASEYTWHRKKYVLTTKKLLYKKKILLRRPLDPFWFFHPSY